MYDAWAAFDSVAETFLLGKTVRGYTVPFAGIAPPADLHAAREQAVSYAAYRLLKYRYRNSPSAAKTLPMLDSVFISLGYDSSFASTDYSGGSPAALGNYIAQSVISFGLQDSSNEQNAYAYKHYVPANESLYVSGLGNSTMTDPNRWQPLSLSQYVDQNGHVFPAGTPKCLTPEWGAVAPFALTSADLTYGNRNGYDWYIWRDPGPEPMLDTLNPQSDNSVAYRWSHTLVSVWSSHHTPADSVMIDISPANIGNVQTYPASVADYPSFYNLTGGGDNGTGRPQNPRTGIPYAHQVVPRGDYTRVLAEFWADGPNSETPPGHWFVILNYVTDQPGFQKKFMGTGPVLDGLEWDVKAYFALGGAVHDAAISAWALKGWYDSSRPISVLRWMADKGQCSDTTLPRYSPAGISLMPGYIELVQPGDPLAGVGNVNVNKIKLWAWRGTQYVGNPATTTAGVGWILADEWVPYQRPTFVTPPFPGFISGHSTFSRAAAEVLTAFTGDEYFPGGMGEFYAPKNAFLRTEEGPSVDVTLQWATYRDAADQCSLSRIWGGIHPPMDDIPGRLMGKQVGISAFNLASKYFNGTVSSVASGTPGVPRQFSLRQNYPNPFNPVTTIKYDIPTPSHVRLEVFDLLGRRVSLLYDGVQSPGLKSVDWNPSALAGGVYFYRLAAVGTGDPSKSFTSVMKMILMK